MNHLQGYSDPKETAAKALATAPIFRIGFGTVDDRQDVADYYKFRMTIKQAAMAQKELGLKDDKHMQARDLNSLAKATDKQLARIRKDIKLLEVRMQTWTLGFSPGSSTTCTTSG